MPVSYHVTCNVNVESKGEKRKRETKDRKEEIKKERKKKEKKKKKIEQKKELKKERKKERNKTTDFLINTNLMRSPRSGGGLPQHEAQCNAEQAAQTHAKAAGARSHR